jgi:hypothetical protein
MEQNFLSAAIRIAPVPLNASLIYKGILVKANS